MWCMSEAQRKAEKKAGGRKGDREGRVGRMGVIGKWWGEGKLGALGLIPKTSSQ